MVEFDNTAYEGMKSDITRNAKMNKRIYLICLPIILTLTACATEKEMPQRGLDYFEAGFETSWPYPSANLQRVYSDDTVFYLSYERSGEGAAPDILNSTHVEGSFAMITQVFAENNFDNIKTICQEDADMAVPTDVTYNRIVANIGGNAGVIVGGCYSGFSEIPEKRQAYNNCKSHI